MGARIVINSFGSYGDVNPYIGLALALRARGHEPVLATAEYYRKAAEGAGIAFEAIRPDAGLDDRELIARIMDPKKGTEVILREVLIPAIRESYDDLMAAVDGADLLLSHPSTYAAPIVAAKMGVPWISTVLAPMTFFSRHDLPVFAVAPWLVHLRRLGPAVSGLLIGMARSATRGWTAPIRALRDELGLPPGGDPIFEGQYSPGLVLGLFSRVLAEPQPDWPEGTRVVGQVAFDGSYGARLSDELETYLRAGPAPVVFTLGSAAVHAAGDFYEESLGAVRLLGCRAVLVAGAEADRLRAGELPDGVMVTRSEPYSKLFPRAAAIVHQGGVGTLGQALRSGRPELVVPFAHDQPDNAFRVTGLGAARTLYPRRYRADRVAHELAPLLDEPAYAARAQRVGEQAGAEDGASAACDAIEERLGTLAGRGRATAG